MQSIQSRKLQVLVFQKMNNMVYMLFPIKSKKLIKKCE